MNFAKEEKEIKSLCEKGWREFTSNDYHAALQSCETLLLLDSDNPMANSLGAACMFRLGQLDEAEPLARKGVELSPHSHLSHIFLAEILFAKGLKDEAEAELWEAIAIEPNDPELRFEVGRFLFSANEYSKAKEHLEKTLEFIPENAEAHFLLSFCLATLLHSEWAEAEVLKAIDLDPNHDRAHFTYGLLKLDKAERLRKIDLKILELRIASKAFSEARRINPQFIKASEHYLYCEQQINNFEDFVNTRSRLIIFPAVLTLICFTVIGNSLKASEGGISFLLGKKAPAINYTESLQTVLLISIIYLLGISLWAWSNRVMLKIVYKQYRFEKRDNFNQQKMNIE